VLLAVATATVAAAQSNRFGNFTGVETSPPSLRLEGAIGETAVLDFRRAMAALPDTRVLFLDSAGGMAANALVIADLVHEAGLATVIAADARCTAACALIFLAGSTRLAVGELGVQQITALDGDPVATQVLLSSVVELLDRFDTPMEVVSLLLRTPPDEMHIFTAPEVERLSLNRGPTGDLLPLLAAAAGPPAAAPASPPISLRANPEPRAPIAVLYEEGEAGAATTVIEATIEWRIVNDPAGPVISATIEIPERHMSVLFSIQENDRAALNFSHEIDFLVTIDPAYQHPAGGVASIPAFASKVTENAIGEPIVGRSYSLPPDFFWFELDPASMQQNLNRLRDRDWFDVGIVYANGQRAILTFDKGSEGERIFDAAMAAWAAN
jgi:hypothetical protein